MPATATRIAFVKQAFRSHIASDDGVRTRYGKVARDSADQPVETFFESMDDVAAINTARFALLSADRRRFEISVAELLDFSGALAFSSVTPAVAVTDDEKGVSARTGIITQIEAMDYETGTTRLGVWG